MFDLLQGKYCLVFCCPLRLIFSGLLCLKLFNAISEVRLLSRYLKKLILWLLKSVFKSVHLLSAFCYCSFFLRTCTEEMILLCYFNPEILLLL